MEKKSSTSYKNTNSKKVTKKRKTPKPKVYIPKYKIILMCLGVIAFCMFLLIITSLIEGKSSAEKPVEVTQKVEAPVKEEKPVKVEPVKPSKPETTTSKNPEKDVETKPVASKPAVQATTEQKKDTSSQTQNSVKTEPVVTKPVETTPEKPVQTTPAVTKPADFGFPKAVNNAQIVFLFDDGGQNLNHLQKFLDLPFPITIAVLPQLKYSKESAQKIRASGKELMLHQPMQALNASVNPGPGAITPSMTEDQIISTLFQNINEIGPIEGINNHEGSAITADAEKMAVILKTVSENGIFFLDSRTNKDTQVPYVSREMGYSYYERNGNFLDNVKTRENALAELKKNIDIANKTGVVIMIGHIWSADFLPQLLMDVYPELKAKGYEITTVSRCRGRK